MAHATGKRDFDLRKAYDDVQVVLLYVPLGFVGMAFLCVIVGFSLEGQSFTLVTGSGTPFALSGTFFIGSLVCLAVGVLSFVSGLFLRARWTVMRLQAGISRDEVNSLLGRDPQPRSDFFRQEDEQELRRQIDEVKTMLRGMDAPYPAMNLYALSRLYALLFDLTARDDHRSSALKYLIAATEADAEFVARSSSSFKMPAFGTLEADPEFARLLG